MGPVCFAVSQKLRLICSLNVVLLVCFGKKNYEIMGMQVGSDFESIAKWWLCYKKYKILNVVTSAALWSIWKSRNDSCFQEARWIGMKIFFACVRRC
jgi:hypothetical protein